jgi:uncharacterized oxidoreductase
MQTTHSAEDLRTHMATVLRAAGSAPEEATTVAENLVEANLRGHDSHGVGMLPRYVEAVLEGGLKPNSKVHIRMDTGTLLNLDGQRGYGQAIGEASMKLGIDRAQQHGSCIMTLGNTHHLGRIGHFAEMAVAQGLVALHFVNVLSRPVVAPFGGADGRYGTNPCCIGVPLAGRPPFLLDFATSRVAQGKMRVAHNEGRQIAPDTLIDEHGRPTTNPAVVVVPQSNGLFGALLAFGEHKGYGLAVACELLGGALTGGGTWHKPTDPSVRTVLNGMLTILIDPSKMATQSAFREEASAFINWLQAGPVAEGFDAVQIAGEPELVTRAQRAVEGIHIDAQTWREIVRAAQSVKVELPIQ